MDPLLSRPLPSRDTDVPKSSVFVLITSWEPVSHRRSRTFLKVFQSAPASPYVRWYHRRRHPPRETAVLGLDCTSEPPGGEKNSSKQNSTPRDSDPIGVREGLGARDSKLLPRRALTPPRAKKNLCPSLLFFAFCPEFMPYKAFR